MHVSVSVTLCVCVCFVSQMPMLNPAFLESHRELRMAHLALSVMTMGYIWQEGENDTVKVTLRPFTKCPSVFQAYLLSLKTSESVRKDLRSEC